MQFILKILTILPICTNLIISAPSPTFCTSEECQQSASSLLSKINSSISPCDNFYDFVCGNIANVKPQDVDLKLLKILDNDIQETDSNHVKLAKNFFNTCVNDRNSINQFVIQKVLESGFPFHEESSENFILHEMIEKFKFFRFQDFYFFEIGKNLANNGNIELLVQISEDFGLDFGKDNFKTVSEIMSFLIDSMIFESAVLEVLIFNQKLLHLKSTYFRADDYIVNVTISDLKTKIFTSIDWTSYITNLFHRTDEVHDDDGIYVTDIELFKNMDSVLKETPQHVLKNFIVLKFILEAFEVAKTDDYFKDASKYHPNRRQSSMLQVSQKKQCVLSLKANLKPAASAIYGREYFSKTAKAGITEMIIMIKEQLLKNFESLDWLDAKTKSKAIEKLQNMKFIVGYPDELDSDEFLDEYYKSLNFSGLNFVEILQACSNFELQKIIQRYKLPKYTIDLENENYQSFIQNAFYSIEINLFMINAAMVDEHFSISRPAAINFGAVGSAIGHEILHGFDNIGRNFDSKGFRINWWEKEADESFNQKAQCLINQYSSYMEPLTGLMINGVSTLGENIADNSGFSLVYKTYQHWLMINKEDLILPYINFTSNQLFWISTAEEFCEDYDKDFLELIIKKDPHTPPRFRIIGAMGNSEEFSNDFNCHAGSEMNRENKCKVW